MSYVTDGSASTKEQSFKSEDTITGAFFTVLSRNNKKNQLPIFYTSMGFFLKCIARERVGTDGKTFVEFLLCADWTITSEAPRKLFAI